MTENARIVDHLLKVEGWPKYTDLRNDRGGPTRGGITLATLSRWRGRMCDRDDLLALEEQEAREIYEQEYILGPGFGRIEDELLRLQLVDAGVLHGPHRAIRWLQEELPPLQVDGVLGPRTAERVSGEDPHRVGLLLAARRQEFLGWLITANYQARRSGRTRQDQSEFAHGWAKRVSSFVRLEAERS